MPRPHVIAQGVPTAMATEIIVSTPETPPRPHVIAQAVPTVMATEIIVSTIPASRNSEPTVAATTSAVPPPLVPPPAVAVEISAVTAEIAGPSLPVVGPSPTLSSSGPLEAIVEPPALPPPTVVHTAEPEPLFAPIQRLALEQWDAVEVVSTEAKRALTPKRLGADATDSFEPHPRRPSITKEPLDVGWGQIEVRRDVKKGDGA